MKEIKNWTKWIYWFTFAVAVIIVYKTLDNFNDISIQSQESLFYDAKKPFQHCIKGNTAA